MDLPVNIEDLLNIRKIEFDRIEFKKGWNPDAIYRSICAFANDFHNTAGGYILIGVEEDNKLAKRHVNDINSLIYQIEETLTGISELKSVRPGVRVSARVIKLIDNVIHNNIQNISEISVRVNDRVREEGMLKVTDILEYCMEEHSRTEILRNIRLTYHQKNYKKFIEPLIKNNWLQMTIPETPNHPGKKYYSTLKGVILLRLLKSSKDTGK